MYNAHLWERLVPHVMHALKMASYQVSCLDFVVQKRYRDKLSLLGLSEDKDSYQTMNFIDELSRAQRGT